MGRGCQVKIQMQARAQWVVDGNILVRGWRPKKTEVREGALPQS